MQAEAVIFDIGNVLIEWQPERYFDRQIGPAGGAKCSPRWICTG